MTFYFDDMVRFALLAVLVALAADTVRSTDCKADGWTTVRTHVGMFSDAYLIDQKDYTTVKACKDLCSETAGCKAIAMSPSYWYHRECFLVSTNEFGPRNRWTSSVRCEKSKSKTIYTVITQTSNIKIAESDDINLTITIHGQYGDVTTRKIESFDRGIEDTFKFDMDDVGDIDSITLTANAPNYYNAWCFDYIVLSSASRPNKLIFHDNGTRRCLSVWDQKELKLCADPTNYRC